MNHVLEANIINQLQEFSYNIFIHFIWSLKTRLLHFRTSNTLNSHIYWSSCVASDCHILNPEVQFCSSSSSFILKSWSLMFWFSLLCFPPCLISLSALIVSTCFPLLCVYIVQVSPCSVPVCLVHYSTEIQHFPRHETKPGSAHLPHCVLNSVAILDCFCLVVFIVTFDLL